MFVVVVVANVVPNVTNVVDLHWFTSNFHIHLHQSANVFHLLETLCHVPSKLHGSTPSTISLMEMSFMVLHVSAPLAMSLVELSSLVSLESI
jgi:hypothetical protein